MSQPLVPIKVAYSDYTLLDLLNLHAKSISQGLNCHAIATVTSFTAVDATTGRPKLTAKMNYAQTYTVQKPDGTYVNELVEYGLLVDCPVVVLGGGPVSFQMPIAVGDECLILFNDRDLNNWWAGASGGALSSARSHSFADGMALVGFKKWAVNDPAHAMLVNAAGAQLGIGTDSPLVRVANNSTTLYTCLSNLIAAIEGITVAPGSFAVSGTPVVGVSGAVSNTSALEAAKTALHGLLE